MALASTGSIASTASLASIGSDLVTGVCMAVILGMAGLLVFRATRERSEDIDDDERGGSGTV